jgi:hypothetical protein
MHTDQREADAIWLAGTMDIFGQVDIKKNTIFVKFKSAYLDRLQAIVAALGINRAPRGPFDNLGASKKPQYDLVLVGKELALLENMVVGRMRTERQHLFQKRREQLRKLREKVGLAEKFNIYRAEDL